MASPHVAGTAAILKQTKPDWTPEQIKGVLMNTAEN
ncbi:S8 family serine peptidase [Bacillus licheniformis]|nr:S8 family serine peptidase [Bacillus licheniformis]